MTDINNLLRNDFLSFARKALRKLDGTILSDDPYLDYLASKLTAFADGEINRLIVNAPPRHLKSQLGTVCLTAWILAHRPNEKIIVLGCSARLAEKLARTIRAILQTKWYRNIFPTRIKKGHSEATNFATTDGGEVFAASIHANITGRGGSIVVVDDPHDTDDAGKPHQLAKAIKRFNKNVRSRLNNQRTGRILVIAHRVSEADLSAHLLARGGWQHVVLPFLATRDETYKTDGGIWRRRKDELLRADAADDERIAELKQTDNFDMLYQQDCEAWPGFRSRQSIFRHLRQTPLRICPACSASIPERRTGITQASVSFKCGRLTEETIICSINIARNVSSMTSCARPGN